MFHFVGYDGLPVRRHCLVLTDWKSVVRIQSNLNLYLFTGAVGWS